MSETLTELSEILERITDAFVAFDKDWCYTYVNKKAGEIMHRKPEDLIGKHLLTEYPDFKNQPLYDAYQKAIATQKYVYFEEFCEPFNAWFENHIYPSADGLTIYYRNITDRKKAEEKLNKSEARYGMLVENIHEALIVEDNDGNLVYANKGFRKIFGYEPDEPLKITLKDYTSPQWYKEVIDRHNKRVKGLPVVEEYEYKGIRKDGAEIWLEARVTTVVENGKIIGTQSLERDITGRKQAEKIIQLSEAKFRIAFYASPDSFSISSLKTGKILETNDGFTKISGFTRDEAIGKTSIEVGILKDSKQREEILLHFGLGTSIIDIEINFYNKNNEQKSGLVSVEKIEWNDETCLLTVLRDITERKKAEEKIRKSEEQYRDLVENITDLIYTHDLGGRILSMNKASEKILGHKFDSKSNINIKDVLTPGTKNKFDSYIADILKNGHVQGVMKVQTRNGCIRTLEFNNTLKTEGVDAPVIRGYARDVTDKKNAEIKLIESELHYRSLIDQASDAIILTDFDGNFIDVNESACKMFGFSKTELLGMNSTSLIDPEELKVKPFQLKQEEIGKQVFSERRMMHKDGTFIDVEANVKKINDNLLLAIVRDITERKIAERKLFESENRLRTIVQTEPECVKLIDSGGELIEMNPAGLAMIEADSLEQVKGTSMFGIIDEPYRKSYIQLTNNVFNGKSRILKFKMTGLKGRQRWLETHAVPMRDADEKIIASLCITRDITEQKKVEDSLKASEEKYRYLFERNLAGVYQGKLNGEILTCNAAFARMLGYDSNQELLSQDARLLYFSNRDRENFITRLSENGELTNHETKMKKKDGSPIYIIENCTLQTLALTGEEIIEGMMVDITAFKKAEEKLSTSEVQYRRLFEAAKDGILILNADTGVIEDVNPFLIELLGYSHDDLLGKELWEISLFKDIVANKNAFLKLQKDGYVRYENLPLETKHGRAIWVEFVSNAYDVNGKQIIQCNIRDITDRKKAEAETKVSQERFRTLYEENPLMNFTLDETGKIHSVNKRGAADLGYHWDELIGSSVFSVFYPEDHKTVLNQIQECILNPRKSFSWEMRKVTKAGKTIWVSETGTALVDVNGNHLVMIVCENITQRKHAELEIIQMNKQLLNLTAHLENIREQERTNIAREIHDELGQQLTGIKMDLTMINQNMMPDNTSTAKRIAGVMLIVDDTINAVRKISTRLRPAVLDDLGLLAAIESHCREFEKRFGITCKFTCNSSMEENHFEKSFATGVFRIYQESLTNIARHSKATGIHCGLKQKGNQLVLSIKDNGSGFKIDDMQNKSLGIVGMKERANMMNGELTIQSTEGKGTHIILTAPIRLQQNV